MRPGSVLSSLLTGMLGIQPEPTVSEAAVWVAYAIPMLAVVHLAGGREGAGSRAAGSRE